MTYEEIGAEIGKLVASKQAAYGDSFGKSGAVMRILYPDGISVEKLDDALTVVRVLDKLFRIATDRDALGESPWRDICGYGLLSAAKPMPESPKTQCISQVHLRDLKQIYICNEPGGHSGYHLASLGERGGYRWEDFISGEPRCSEACARPYGHTGLHGFTCVGVTTVWGTPSPAVPPGQCSHVCDYGVMPRVQCWHSMGHSGQHQSYETAWWSLPSKQDHECDADSACARSSHHEGPHGSTEGLVTRLWWFT